jgi:TPR repeat protein
MANREELLIIRSARAGHPQAQLALGKRYLFGSTNLPQSHATALHWLEKAAEQNQSEAWMLIGEHVSFTVARQAEDPLRVAVWYERAFEGKSARAGLVFAMLVFSCWPRAEDGLRQKSMRALKTAAEAGIADAQWLYAQQLGMHELLAANTPQEIPAQIQQRRDQIVEWAAKAALGGIAEAQQALADYWWKQGDVTRFMLWGLPIAQEWDRKAHGPMAYRCSLDKQQLGLFLRCAKAMTMQADTNLRLVERYLKIAAEGGDAKAQLAYGLWAARMDEDGNRVRRMPGVAHYKKAIRWLSQAAENGEAAAWFAISRIYLKPEFSRRSISESRRCLELAGVAGHRTAQLELAQIAWRTRKVDRRGDVRAVYWLQKAASQGDAEAVAMLNKIAPAVRRSEWAASARASFNRDISSQYPFLAARVELAYWFGLTRAEALLIDVEASDHGHCLEVDIRDSHPRSRRRLIQILTGEQRRALERASRVFDIADARGQNGPEGNYRQRLYRFRSIFGQQRATQSRRA